MHEGPSIGCESFGTHDRIRRDDRTTPRTGLVSRRNDGSIAFGHAGRQCLARPRSWRDVRPDARLDDRMVPLRGIRSALINASRGCRVRPEDLALAAEEEPEVRAQPGIARHATHRPREQFRPGKLVAVQPGAAASVRRQSTGRQRRDPYHAKWTLCSDRNRCAVHGDQRPDGHADSPEQYRVRLVSPRRAPFMHAAPSLSATIAPNRAPRRAAGAPVRRGIVARATPPKIVMVGSSIGRHHGEREARKPVSMFREST